MVSVRCSKYEISTSEPSKGEHKHAYNRQQLSICNYFPSAVLRRWSELGFYSDLCLQLIQFYLYENKKWLYAVDLVGSMGHWYWVVVRKTCATELATLQVTLFQYSYNIGIYITIWRDVQVCLVNKMWDHSTSDNYHPVSFLLNTHW